MATPLHTSLDPSMLLLPVPDRGLVGAGCLGFEPMPVQVEMWRLLEAEVDGLPLHENTAIEIVRRVGKTEGLFCLAVGRCKAIPGYEVTYCAQTGQKSRERFYGILKRLRRFDRGGDWRARESRGEERIEFGNGSVLRFLPPKASAFRGDAVDWLILDEAQEVDEEDAADLIGSVLPTFDTRDGAQLTVAGTAGEVRSGLLWEALVKGRAGLWGILEYAAPDGTEDATDEDLWLQVHPGPAGFAGDVERTLALLRKRFASMGLVQFAREYLGLWPEDVTTAAFDAEVWQRLGRPQSAQPDRLGIGFDVKPGARWASVAVAWRDEGGAAWVEVVAENTARDIIALARKFKVPVGYDTAGVDTLAVADDIARISKGAVTLRPLSTMEFAASCVTFSNAVQQGILRHTYQQQLKDAIEVASRRTIRDAGWAWGRKGSTGDISPLVAATVALRVFDDLPPARIVRALSARSA